MGSGAPSAPRVEIEGEIATITLNRPAQRNRLEQQDLQVLLDAFSRIDADDAARVVVLTANTAGQPRPVFCAGFHIGDFASEGHDETLFAQVADALAALRPVTVCALNGSVYGGATDLVLACDVRIGLAATEFRVPATALGLHYYGSGLQRYVATLGLAGAKRAFLTARPFSAERLLQIGLLEDLAASPAELQRSLAGLVADILALAPLAVQATKRSLNEIAAGQPDPGAMQERQRRAAASHDFAEGRLAFAEKRKPRFLGR
jgi:enoyl-CoA hydratase/carnithine racemase